MKKLVALVLSLMMVLSVCSFASAEGVNIDVTIWVAEEIKDLTAAQIEEFNATNPYGITFNATIEAVSEADAATNMITDVEAGADIFCFAQDQFARLVQAGAVAKLSDESAAWVKENNAAGVVAAATSGEALFAYPLTADNGYFMYYDKSVIPEEDIDSMEAIIADCEAAGKFFSFEMESSAWYLASFFFATGCVSEWVTDDDGQFIEVYDTFNSPQGLIAVKGMQKLVQSSSHNSSSKGAEFASNSAVVVTGTWDYVTVQDILGDNMGVADLPSFEVDGVSYHLGSFNGCKLMGVKPQVDSVKAEALELLAEYLTGYDCQMQRFDARAWGPSNLAAQASEAVQANPGLAALLAQSPYSLPQGQIHGSWWDIAKVIGDDVKDATDEAGLQLALDNYQEKIAALFTLSDDVKFGWTIIGTCNSTDGFFYTDYNGETRSNWGEDLPMEKVSVDTWKSAQAWDIEAGAEFKVRQGLSWDNAFPGDNFKVEEAGYYYIVFNETTGEVSLEAAE
ncbi:MAG: sugar ABC transporter substrate-binding protein [Clostridiales bacterium]|nr:sugar ABC transporter substrate-binding protein [Clostridiales bacterium]